MAMVRSSRVLLAHIAAACGGRNSAALHCASSSSSSPMLVASETSAYSRSFSSYVAASWRNLISLRTPSPFGDLLLPNARAPAPQVTTIITRSYAKRPKKWQGVPHAFVQVEPGAACPPYSPNAGSVKNRKHKKRMAQRDAFAKAQAQKRKQETKVAVIARDAARRKRWKEGAARARAWAQQLAKAAEEAKMVAA